MQWACRNREKKRIGRERGTHLNTNKLDVGVHTFHPRSWGAEAGGSVWVEGRSGLHIDFHTDFPASRRKEVERGEREWGHTQTAHESTNETLPPSGIRRKHVFKGRQEFHSTVGIQKLIFTMCDSLKNPVVHRAEGLLPESENGVHVYAVAKPSAPGSQSPLFTYRVTTPKEPVSPVLVQLWPPQRVRLRLRGHQGSRQVYSVS